MRGLVLAVLVAGGALALAGAPSAEAACRATPDGAGGARVRCDDGSTGRLRPDNNGTLRGTIGERPVQVRPRGGASSSQTRTLPGSGVGASGRGARESATGRSANPCMSGGALRTDCN